MRSISGDEAYRLSGNGNFQEGFVVRVRQRVPEGGGGHDEGKTVNRG